MLFCENDIFINWKWNLIVVWLGCFFIGVVFSLVMFFLFFYVEQFGVIGYFVLNMWFGIVFSIIFLFLVIVLLFWGGFVDCKGWKFMLLCFVFGMGIVMVLMGLV